MTLRGRRSTDVGSSQASIENSHGEHEQRGEEGEHEHVGGRHQRAPQRRRQRRHEHVDGDVHAVLEAGGRAEEDQPREGDAGHLAGPVAGCSVT